MRLATIATATGLRLHVRGTTGYVDLAEATGDETLASMAGLLEAGMAQGMDAARRVQGRAGVEYDQAAFGPVLPHPNRVLCLGVNYREHAIEGGRDDAPPWPESFIRCPGTALGPYADLVRPALSEQFDYEGELAVIIGENARYVPADKASGVIAGYAVLNDASAREWQRAGSQWTAGKNFEGSMPFGPELVTQDEADLSDAQLTTRLNGEVMQSARTSQMVTGIGQTVEFFSSFTELRPGDVIATGTPGGVGFARRPPVWLKPGDVVEVTIEGVGTIRNRVVAEEGDLTDWPWHPPPINTPRPSEPNTMFRS
ncbi:MAG TPA: fumarylacetoacetate hydrolase family protein [Acidimicrobiales bacterium]|nr:fumarylacetoacetate hydrolase family protein [Acidimicrobiales bacterium]